MTLSLITITYNAATTLRDCLASVATQTVKEVEHILVDGGSTDNTLAIANTFPHITTIISEPDKGIYDAINKGIRAATGEIIGFLHADDTFYDAHSLQTIVEAFDPTTEAVFGDLIYTDAQNTIKRVWTGSPFQKGAFQKGWMPAHPTFYCRKSVYKKYGLYDDTYTIAGDFELMLRFFEKHTIQSKYIPQTLVNMKLGGVSNASIQNKIRILQEEFRSFAQNNLPVNKFLYLWAKAKNLCQFRF